MMRVGLSALLVRVVQNNLSFDIFFSNLARCYHNIVYGSNLW